MNNKPALAILYLVTILAAGACGGSSGGGSTPVVGGSGSGGGGGSTIEAATVSLGTSVKNVQIQSGTPTTVSFTYTAPANLLNEPITAYQRVSVDLDATMANVRVTSSPVADAGGVGAFDLLSPLRMLAKLGSLWDLLGIESAYAAETATVDVYVSYPGDPDACSNGVPIGSYNFTGDFDTQPTSDTSAATTSGAAEGRHVIATGTFQICLQVSPLAIPMDAYVTVDAVEIDAEPCELQPPVDADVIGAWSGIYTCTNFGTGDDVEQPVTLSIAKNADGSYTYTDDDGASYDGHFCGSTFRFNGGLAGDYTESGMFTITGAGTARKESTWNSVPPGLSGGVCNDDLARN